MLVAPFFADQNPSLFDFFAATLNEALTSLDLSSSVQLMFFHPNPTTTDEDGGGKDVDFAMSPPYPIVVLLRTAQVESARQTRELTGSAETSALVELHERLCGPEGGLLQ